MIINEDNYETLKKVSDITLIDYDIKWLNAENTEGFIDCDNLLTMIEDLIVEYHNKEEEIDDLKQDIEDNYELKRIDPYDEYGISRNDFI